MPVVVKKVSSRREMRTFISFAYNLYKNHPCYVPNLLSDDAATLDRKKNHAFEFCEADYFLAAPVMIQSPSANGWSKAVVICPFTDIPEWASRDLMLVRL